MQTDYYDTIVGTTVDGIVLVSSSWAHTLFDTSASHSFILVLFTSMLGLEYELLDFILWMCCWVEIVSCSTAVVQCVLRLTNDDSWQI